MKTKKQSFTNIDFSKPGPHGEAYMYVPGAGKILLLKPHELKAFLRYISSLVRPRGIYAVHNGFYYEAVNEVCNTEEEFQQKCAEYLRIGFKVHHTCSKWKMTDSDN
jgi:hypothetical protein